MLLLAQGGLIALSLILIDEVDNAYGDADQDEQKDGEVLIEVHREDAHRCSQTCGTCTSAQAGFCFGAVGETRTRTAFATTPSR